MASGAQIAKETIEAFNRWAEKQTDEYFKAIQYRGKLKRGILAEAIGCGKSAFNQNDKLKKLLEELELDLTERGIFNLLESSESIDAGNIDSEHFNKVALKNSPKRKGSLKDENIELRLKILELEKRLERFSEMNEALSEFGLFPR